MAALVAAFLPSVAVLHPSERQRTPRQPHSHVTQGWRSSYSGAEANDLEPIFRRGGVDVLRRIHGPNAEFMLALRQAVNCFWRETSLPRLAIDLAFEPRALLVRAKLQLDCRLLGLVRRALGDFGLGGIGVGEQTWRHRTGGRQWTGALG